VGGRGSVGPSRTLNYLCPSEEGAPAKALGGVDAILGHHAREQVSGE
jgi:hypothetical protein